jgi:type II secretory pathway predicted ATPase ExeA
LTAIDAEALVWSDNETAVDSVNVQHVVGAILQLLDMEQLSPVTIGVYGDWGSGKSSVVLMLQEHLSRPDRKDGTLCVVFNGWRFDGYEDAKSALITTILEEIENRKTLVAEVREAATALLRRVDWMRIGKSTGRLALHAGLAVATSGATLPVSIAAEIATRVKGADADTITDAIAHVLKAEQGKQVHDSVREFERDFAKVMDQTKLQRLVVVIDDLDRCNPTQVIETLEAIRLFLAVPKTAFIIAADEEMVQNAARLRFPGMESLSELGRDYLEKMIQIPIRVPPLGQRDLESYLNMLFLQLHVTEEEFRRACEQLRIRSAADIEFRVTPENAAEVLGRALTEAMRLDLALASQIRGVVAMSVDGNPRQLKRYLNAFRLRLLVASARGATLNGRVAAKLMLLEYFRLETFRTIARWQAAHGGVALELAAIESDRVSRTGQDAATAGQEASSRHAAPRTGTEGARVARPPRDAETPATSATPAETAATPQESVPVTLPTEAALWASDEWMKAWLEAEPLLGAENLSPYFYFARDRLAARSAATQRMSPAARDVLAQLLSPGKAVRDTGAARAKQLLGTDAVALLEAVAERVRASENTHDASAPFQGTLALVKARPELITEFVAVLRSLPVGRISAGTPNRLLLLATALSPTAGDLIRSVLGEWRGQAENSELAGAARLALQGPA